MSRFGLILALTLCAFGFPAVAVALDAGKYSCQILQPLLQRLPDQSEKDLPAGLCFDDKGSRSLEPTEQASCVRPKENTCVSVNAKVITFLVNGSAEVDDGVTVCDLTNQACTLWQGYRNAELLDVIANDVGDKFVLLALSSLRHGIFDASILAFPVGFKIPLEEPASLSLIDTSHFYSEDDEFCGEADSALGINELKRADDVGFLRVDRRGNRDVVVLQYLQENCIGHHGKSSRIRRFSLIGDHAVELLPPRVKRSSRTPG